jgi:hypothetical protein
MKAKEIEALEGYIKTDFPAAVAGAGETLLSSGGFFK